MQDALETALYLLGEHSGAPALHDRDLPSPYVRRTLEAGLVVSYLRPFTKSFAYPRLERLSDLPEGLVDAHDDCLDVRNKVYAHTDDTPLRSVGPLDEWIRGEREIGVVELWTPPTRDRLRAISQLAQLHRDAFDTEARELGDRLAPRLGDDSGAG